MKPQFAACALALGCTTTAAFAGGIDRSGMPMGWLFEEGRYAELSYGHVNPTVGGATLVPLGPLPAGSPSGDLSKSYGMTGLAFKMDVNDRLSFGLQYDESFGADIAYPTVPYPLAATTATIDSDSIMLAARYKFNNGLSIHGGLRSVGVGGNVTIVNGGAVAYSAAFASDRDTGFMLGAAFEKPEIALRVALTYFSQTDHNMPTTLTVPFPLAAVTPVSLPQSVNLDVQTGIAKDTLLFGQIRWADWTAVNLVGPGPQPLLNYANDSFTYTLGLGRKFNENWSGAISIGYEKSQGGIQSNFEPTDGRISLGLGATYTRDNMKITGGVRYVKLGDATALAGAARFTDNSALAFGLKVGFTF
jgi:long-subunit fatty acid transport protein